MIWLKALCREDIEKEWQFVRDMPEDENGLTNEWPGVSLEEFRDRLRPSLTIVGLVESDREIRAVWCPVTSYESLYCFYTVFTLDIARYTLTDYHQAGEFRSFAKGLLDGQQGEAAFLMDTSYADRIYQMHRLLETLYPLTVAAALPLGGVLPGLIVLHAARELSILRALGVKARRCVGVYTLAQVLCALAGLILGFLLVLLLRRPDPDTALRPMALYLAAHLAAWTSFLPPALREPSAAKCSRSVSVSTPISESFQVREAVP